MPFVSVPEQSVVFPALGVGIGIIIIGPPGEVRL